MNSLLGHNQPPLPTQPYNWYYVTPRFTRLLSNLAVSDKNREAGLKKFNNVVASLNRRYYDHNSETLNGIVIGSWARKLRSRRLAMSMFCSSCLTMFTFASAAIGKSPIPVIARGQRRAVRDQFAHDHARRSSRRHCAV